MQHFLYATIFHHQSTALCRYWKYRREERDEGKELLLKMASQVSLRNIIPLIIRDWLTYWSLPCTGATLTSALCTNHSGAGDNREQWTEYYCRYTVVTVYRLLLLWYNTDYLWTLLSVVPRELVSQWMREPHLIPDPVLQLQVKHVSMGAQFNINLQWCKCVVLVSVSTVYC